MPALSYPTADFVPFTKILSSEVNGKFNAISTLLNTTKLNSTNVQAGGLTYDRMATVTSSQVVVTSAAGVMTLAAVIPSSNGGLGFSFTSTTLNAALVVQANALGTALTLGTSPLESGSKIYNFYRFS